MMGARLKMISITFPDVVVDVTKLAARATTK
jgi:hypothetical protein